MIPRELLKSGAEALGVPLSTEQLNSFFIYFAELRKWNKQINLTTITDEQDIVIKHGLDSLSYIKGFVPTQGMGLLDMGSGAGFPALPIKIAHPEINILMVESVKKKASFLRHIIRTLKLTNADVADKRIEELPALLLASFDIVTARAFANMKTALASGAMFLKPGGLMVLSRGPEETIQDSELNRAGVSLERRIVLTLPRSDNKRAIWVFRKTL
jgi:16S rRNA (guanine527-N7)-methyltransferase